MGDIEKYLDIIKEYLISKHCAEMDFSYLKEFIIVDRSELPQNVDARTKGNNIIVSKQSILGAMNTVPLYELEEYLEKPVVDMEEKITFILGNIYHEFCHMHEKKEMPQIHNVVSEEGFTVLEKLVSRFWIEFVVEYKSGKKHFKSEKQFCDSFVEARWDIKYIKVNRDDVKDLYWLINTSAYFIALCYAHDCIEYYLNRIQNNEIRYLMEKLYNSCVYLYNNVPVDDMKIIYNIGKVFESGIDKNSSNFAMLYC